MDDLEKWAADYRAMRETLAPDDRHRWILFIKELRATYGYSIEAAEQDALSQPVWRRWVERQINTDPRCEKMARYHIRHRAERALIREQDGKLIIR
jgi:hypothetical protein